MALVFGLIASVTPSEGADAYSIHWRTDQGTNQFLVEVTGLGAEATTLRKVDWDVPRWQRLLAVYAKQEMEANSATLPAMAGSYRVSEDSLLFQPQFPLAPSVRYKAVLDPNQFPGAADSGAPLITALYVLPRPPAASTTTVGHVYPTAAVLPENLLKFYLHFSAPMSRGNIYDYIHLRDDNGKDVDIPFLEIGEELWDPAMTRLTLFIDPGRIKRGLRPLEEVGPALQQGKNYTLVIDRAWKDAAGNPLKKGFEKRFSVVPPDREPLEPARWKLRAPRSGTRQPLSLTFSKPLDEALAQRVIHVTTESGQQVEGKTSLQDEERHWMFVPKVAWPRGAHQLLIETTIEDLAGNNIGKPFEVDLLTDPPDSLTNQTVRLPFEIR